MATVLIFAEHELNMHEVAMMREALTELRDRSDGSLDATVLVPYESHRSTTFMDDAVAAHGISATRALDDARHDAATARASARRALRHVLAAVRGAGHPATGELVAVGDVARGLVGEAVARGSSTVLVVSSPHRVAHVLHRDLEHRLRRAGIAHVVRLDGGATSAR